MTSFADNLCECIFYLKRSHRQHIQHSYFEFFSLLSLYFSKERVTHDVLVACYTLTMRVKERRIKIFAQTKQILANRLGVNSQKIGNCVAVAIQFVPNIVVRVLFVLLDRFVEFFVIETMKLMHLFKT